MVWFCTTVFTLNIHKMTTANQVKKTGVRNDWIIRIDLRCFFFFDRKDIAEADAGFQDGNEYVVIDREI